MIRNKYGQKIGEKVRVVTFRCDRILADTIDFWVSEAKTIDGKPQFKSRTDFIEKAIRQHDARNRDAFRAGKRFLFR